MYFVACAPPTGPMEIAPLSSLLSSDCELSVQRSAFWLDDDSYVMQEMDGDQASWFRIEGGELLVTGDDSTRLEMAALLANVTPIAAGRVSFPVGSSGRTVFRVWRANGQAHAGRTRILGVRAARSRRQPA